MFKQRYIFRSEDEEFEALCNPMHIRQAAAVALTQHGVKFMEVAEPNGETLMVCVHRPGNPNGGFMYLFPEETTTNK